MIKSISIIVFLLIASFLSSCSIFRHNEKDKDLLSERERYEFNYSFMEAEKQKMLGNFEEAKFLYEKCNKLDPSSAATLYELSTLLVQKEDSLSVTRIKCVSCNASACPCSTSLTRYQSV